MLINEKRGIVPNATDIDLFMVAQPLSGKGVDMDVKVSINGLFVNTSQRQFGTLQQTYSNTRGDVISRVKLSGTTEFFSNPNMVIMDCNEPYNMSMKNWFDNENIKASYPEIILIDLNIKEGSFGCGYKLTIEIIYYEDQIVNRMLEQNMNFTFK